MTARSSADWPIADAVLTLVDETGAQIARLESDVDGRITTEPLARGSYTALVSAPGFQPHARTAVVSTTSATELGTVVLARSGDVDLPAAGTWTIDSQHSRVAFVSQHLGISVIRGQFDRFHGSVGVTDPVERSTVHAEIDTASIDTGNAMRDTHLRSADFLDVQTYPSIVFDGQAPRPTGDDTWHLPGALTIHGMRQPSTLVMRYHGVSDDPWGGRRAGFEANIDLHRDDFNITFDERLLSGIALIGSAIRVELDIQLVLNP